MNSIAPTVHPAILCYARGEVSASRAADLLGPDATIHDVIAQLRQAGLEPPRPPREVELAQLERARQLLGMTP